MALLKVTITNTDKGNSIHALFNPKEYTISKQTNWVTHEQYGKDVPDVQFTIGQRKELSMELFFDTYTTKQDVKEYVHQIEELMMIDSVKERPPILLVAWGKSSLAFNCVLEQMEQRYTMFTNNGIPVRAIVNVVFKEINPKQNKGSMIDKKKGSLVNTKKRSFKEGESLQQLAAQEYGDPAMWKKIAEHNNIDDPLSVKAGTSIQLPSKEGM